MNLVGFWAIIIWSIFLIFLVFFDIRKKRENISFEGFVLGKHQFNKWQIALSLIASYIGGGTLIAFAGQVTKIGFAFIFIPVGVFLAFIIFGFVSKFYRRVDLSKEEFAQTAVQRIVQTYGDDLFWPVFLIMAITLISFIAIQLYGGALLLSEVLNINKVLAAAIITGITGVYSRIGGSRGDVITDIFQGLIILIVIFVSIFILFNGNPITELSNNLALNQHELLNPLNQGWGFIIAMIILPFFAIHTDPSLHLRLYIARNDAEAKGASIIASIIYLFFGFSLIIVTLGIFSLGLGDGDNILIDFALNKSHPIIGVGFTIAIYSAVISTMDSQSIKLSSIFVNDLYSKFDNNINEDNIHQGKMVRVILPWIFVLGFAFSLILFAFETAFLFLSSIWVIGIASFGLLFVGLWWSRLRDIMISNKRLLKYDVTISTILVFLLIGYFLLKGDSNPSTKLLIAGTIIVITKLSFYLIKMLIVTFKKNN
ncbi:MAG: hypothetical protein IPN10_18015 [Saprospiraceae bacterium]|nr:hypothetical protein [Saprospiraceae bacterium]